MPTSPLGFARDKSLHLTLNVYTAPGLLDVAGASRRNDPLPAMVRAGDPWGVSGPLEQRNLR